MRGCGLLRYPERKQIAELQRFLNVRRRQGFGTGPVGHFAAPDNAGQLLGGRQLSAIHDVLDADGNELIELILGT